MNKSAASSPAAQHSGPEASSPLASGPVTSGRKRADELQPGRDYVRIGPGHRYYAVKRVVPIDSQMVEVVVATGHRSTDESSHELCNWLPVLWMDHHYVHDLIAEAQA